MRKYIIPIATILTITVTALLLPSFRVSPGEGIYADQQQALRAFEQLNKVRKDPNSFSERYGITLKGIPSSQELTWNDTLAMVAQNKALDMAQKDYFGSVDKDGFGINYYINKAGYRIDTVWRKHNKADNFAAFDGGAPSGPDAIREIVVGKPSTVGDGKELLLGMGDFNSTLVDCGVGFVHGIKETKYRTYTCIIIARHHPKK